VNYWLEDFKKLNWTTIDIFQVTKLVCNFRKSIEPNRIGRTKGSNGFQHYRQDLQVTDEGDGSVHVMKIL
jgi:hypothetical protein